MRRALIALLLFAVISLLASRAVEQISLASYWYLSIRYDRLNYTYDNAIAEVADPANQLWIDNRSF